MELYYYVRGEQWDKVVAGYKAAVSDMRTLSLLNLALACQGELGDKLFHYPQQGKGGLLPEWNSTVPGAIVLSDICYQMGKPASFATFGTDEYPDRSLCGSGKIHPDIRADFVLQRMGC